MYLTCFAIAANNLSFTAGMSPTPFGANQDNASPVSTLFESSFLRGWATNFRPSQISFFCDWTEKRILHDANVDYPSLTSSYSMFIYKGPSSLMQSPAPKFGNLLSLSPPLRCNAADTETLEAC